MLLLCCQKLPQCAKLLALLAYDCAEAVNVVAKMTHAPEHVVHQVVDRAGRRRGRRRRRQVLWGKHEARMRRERGNGHEWARHVLECSNATADNDSHLTRSKPACRDDWRDRILCSCDDWRDRDLPVLTTAAVETLQLWRSNKDKCLNCGDRNLSVVDHGWGFRGSWLGFCGSWLGLLWIMVGAFVDHGWGFGGSWLGFGGSWLGFCTYNR